MKKEKKPCIFCRGFKLRKIDFILIVLVCLVMYWVNQYQIAQIAEESTQKISKKQD